MGRRRPATMGDIVGSNIPGVIADHETKQRPKRKSPVQVLEEARDRLMSLDPDASNYRPEYRPPFRGGFAQCRNAAHALLSSMITEIMAERRKGD